MIPSKKTSALLAAAASLLLAATGYAQSINTFPQWDGSNSISDWGVPTTETYGETFTPTGSQSTPRSITFAIDNNSSNTIPFQAFVYKFSGNAIVGPALFESTVSSVPTSGAVFENIKVSLTNTGNGNLVAGQQYVVFYTVNGLGGAHSFSNWGQTTTLSPTSGFAFANNGTFAELFTPGEFDTTLFPDELAFLLQFGIGAFSPYALTPNQRAVATGLDHADATNNPGIQKLANYLGGIPTAFLPASFDLISGEEYTSIFDTQFTEAHIQNQDITNHLADIHAAENDGMSLGLVVANVASDGKSVVDGKDSKGIVTPATPDDRWSFFASANGDYTNVTSDFNANGFSYSMEGITLGLDYKLLPQLTVGTYLGYEHSFTSLSNGGSIDTGGVTGGLYGTWFSHGFYVNGIVGGGYSDNTARRVSIGGAVRGNPDGSLFNTLIGTGYDLHHGGWTFGPQVALEYDEAGIESFTENGSLAPLSVNSQSEDSLRSTVGGHLSYTWVVNGVTVRPDVHAEWQHEYDDTTSSLGAGIAGTNAGFVVQGPQLGRDSVLVGTGVTVDLSKKTSVSLNYEGQFGRTNMDQNTVSVGLRMKF